MGVTAADTAIRAANALKNIIRKAKKKPLNLPAGYGDYDPLDLDLCLNADGTGYINIENEEYQQIELLGNPALFSNK